jgi:uncharacterized protein
MYKKLTITHHNCTDGCTSRAIFENLLGDTSDYLAVDHVSFDRDKFPSQHDALVSTLSTYKNTSVVMADICLPFDMVETLLKNGNEVHIIDHHASMAPTIEKLAALHHPKLKITFDGDGRHSGAMLSWLATHPGLEPPDFVELVEDGDLFTFQLAETKALYAGMNSIGQPADVPPQQFIEWLTNSSSLEPVIRQGYVAHNRHMEQVAHHAAIASPISIDGMEGFWVEAPSALKSELGNALAKRHGTFGMVVTEKSDAFQVSLRSVGGVDVSAIAARYGGGGHPCASAFRLQTRADFNSFLSTLTTPTRKRKLP